MDDGIDGVLLETGRYRLWVGQVAFVEIPPPDKVLKTANQIVEGNGVETAAAQLLAAMGADITGPACDQHVGHISDKFLLASL